MSAGIVQFEKLKLQRKTQKKNARELLKVVNPLKANVLYTGQ